MKNFTIIIGKLYLGIVALFLAYLGISWGFMVEKRFLALDISTSSISAINTLKSIMGTALISMAAFTVLFITNSKKWFSPMIIMTIAIIVIRVISLLTDGFHERMAIYALLEVLILLALIVIHRIENTSS